MILSEEQIISLAPDPSSAKSGKELANPAKWVSKGANEQALWGECKGSGSKPYQTQVDLKNIAFKCSCPSRKFPCKHGLGLMLLYSRQAGTFTDTSTPSWVEEWLKKRTEKEEKKKDKPEKAPDPKAQAKRVQARQRKVDDGISELQLWIKDIIRNGILSIPEKGSAAWDNIAKRMVDAQAPGLASLLRNTGDINFYREGWQTPFMDHLLRIHLICESYKRIDQLPEALQSDVRTLIGFSQDQDEIKAQEAVRDDWFVLARQTSQEEQLTVHRNWLYGTRTGRYALYLQFSVRGQLPAISLAPGYVADADIVYFKSASPLRALVKEHYSVKPPASFIAYENWSSVCDAQSKEYLHSPLTAEWPVIVENIRLALDNGRWMLMDDEGNAMYLVENYQPLWKLLGCSGGRPVRLFMTGKENVYEPLGAWANETYITL